MGKTPCAHQMVQEGLTAKQPRGSFYSSVNLVIASGRKPA
jgi:hypothetical protein